MSAPARNRRAKVPETRSEQPPLPVFAIPGELAQAILNYLAQRPFAEVAAMIAGMREMQPIETPAATA